MSETPYSLEYRISRAALVGIFNFVLWILIPIVLLGQLGGGSASSAIALSYTFVYAFGITITTLQVLGTLTKGMALSVPFTSGSYVAEAYYMWSAVNGGVLTINVAGFSIGLSFPLLLFLFMLPALLSTVKAPISYLLEQSEASRASPDTI